MERFSGAHVVGPGEAIDSATGRVLRLFSEVVSIFQLFAEHGVPIAIASASPAAATASRLLRGFGLWELTRHAHIAPGKKDVHLKAISRALGVELSRALFFDDLAWNIKTAQQLGVGGCVLVRAGLCRDDVRQALRRLRERGRGAAMLRAWMRPPQAVGNSTCGQGGSSEDERKMHGGSHGGSHDGSEGAGSHDGTSERERAVPEPRAEPLSDSTAESAPHLRFGADL